MTGLPSHRCSPRSRRFLPHGLWLGLAAGLALLSSGCVHRRITVTSDPPGAMLYVEGEEKGPTPCSFDYTYYGTREFTLVKDGYETLTTLQPVRRPWYQILPFEFFADNLSPAKINDRRTFNYRLNPQVVVPTQDLLERASGLRNEAEIPQ